MRHPLSVVLLAAALTAIGPGPVPGLGTPRALAGGRPAAAPADGVDPAVFEEVSRLVREHFFDPDLRGLDWPAVEARHRPLAAAATSAGELSAAINGMLAELATSHTAHYTPSEVAYYHLLAIFAGARPLRPRVARLFGSEGVRYAGLGAFVEEIDGRSFVTGVWAGSSADRAGLEVGDELVAVDGAPFHPIAPFRGRAGETVELAVRRERDGPVAAVPVVVEEIRPKRALLEAMRASARVIERGGRRIGYIRVWSYAGREYQDLLVEELWSGRLRDAEALVIDLRGGWGGASPSYLDPFLPGPEMRVRDRGGREHPVAFKWRRPVGLLIDEGTRSGKEILARGFRGYGLGPVVGERTAGAVVAGRAFLLGDDSLLYLAVNDVTVDGERLEGPGVAPDIEVPFDPRYAGDTDPQLERIVRELAEELGAGRTPSNGR